MSTRRDCLALSPSWDARSLSTKSGFFSSASRRLSCCSTAIGRDAPQESLLLRGYVPRSPLGSSRFPPVLSPINLVPTRFDVFAFRGISDHCLCVRRRPGKLVSKEKSREGNQWALDIPTHIPHNPARSQRFWDGRLRHRFHGATARDTRLPACEWEHWLSGSTPVFPLCERVVPNVRQRRACWCKPQTPGTCAHVRVALSPLRSVPALW